MQHDVPFSERHIYREPPSSDELRRLAAVMPQGARDLLSFRGQRFRTLGLDPAALTADDAMRLLLEDPHLLRRPLLVFADGTAVAGYDPDAYSRKFAI